MLVFRQVFGRLVASERVGVREIILASLMSFD
jgi:hypothetical protein